MKKNTEFALLVKKGTELIREYGSQTWTDYNIHDPGITILEYLCYTLCELDSLCLLPIEDLFAPNTDSLLEDVVRHIGRKTGTKIQLLEMPPENVKERTFHEIDELLPGRALTFRDYRKLLIDFEGVKNAWIEKSQESVGQVALKGLYQAHLALEEWADEKARNFILKEAREILLENRNLCEDLTNVCIMPELDVALDIEIELSTDSNPSMVLGTAAYLIDQYLSPEIPFYSLAEMQKKGISITDIFSGPLLNHGFILDEELDRFKPMSELHNSDVLQLLLSIKGIIGVTFAELQFVPDETLEKTEPQLSWGLRIPRNHTVRFSPNHSCFRYQKNGRQFILEQAEVIQQFNLVKAQNAPRSFDRKQIVPAYPGGENRNFAKYNSLQNHFPSNYGIGQAGLSKTVSPLRQAQAKQLKAYLLLFEQFMADYRCQLANVGKLFSFSAKKRTRFVQLVEGIPGMDQLLRNEADFLPRLEKIAENKREFQTRRNRFLDHLLARYAEELDEYENILSSIHGREAQPEIIAAKERILNSYETLSRNRLAAWNYKIGGNDNSCVSGMEQRIRTLFGLDDDGGLENLYDMFLCVKRPNEIDALSEYRFYLKDGDENVLLSSSRHFYSNIEMERLMKQVCIFGDNRENYRRGQEDYGEYAGQYYYQLLDRNGRVIADQGAFYHSRKKRDQDLEKTLEFMKKYTRESVHMYTLEHILLRPTTITETYQGFSYDKKTTETDWQNLYSQQISIFLPDWPLRFQNNIFKEFFLRSIYEYTPSHIYPHIFWLNRNEMEEFENVLFQWQYDFANRSEFLDRSLFELKGYLGKLLKEEKNI